MRLISICPSFDLGQNPAKDGMWVGVMFSWGWLGYERKGKGDLAVAASFASFIPMQQIT